MQVVVEMVWPNIKRNNVNESEVTRLDQREQLRNEIIKDENNNTNAEMQAAGGIAFDFQVIDDEKILSIFDSSNTELYCEHVMPLLPLFSRMNFLTNCSLIEAAAYKLRVRISITQLKNQIKVTIPENDERTKVYMLLDNLLQYACMRINDSIQGFKLIQLTDRTKNIKFTDETPQPKKRGLFG
jgi:hypothetical protein